MDESTTHGVLCSSASLVVGCWVVVEGYDALAPVELDHHEREQVCVVLGARQVVVGLDQPVREGVHSREEVADLLGGVVVDVAEGLDVGQPLDVVAVVGQPDCGVEGDLVILGKGEGTMSSMALESLVKTLSNILGRSYSWEARSL